MIEEAGKEKGELEGVEGSNGFVESVFSDVGQGAYTTSE